jgi:hypothetical protein
MNSRPGRVQALLAEFARVGVMSAEQFLQSRAIPKAHRPASIPHDDMLALLQRLPDRAGPDAVRDAVIAHWDSLPDDREPDA